MGEDRATVLTYMSNMANLKRSKGLNATKVLFDAQTPFKSYKDVFLRNA